MKKIVLVLLCSVFTLVYPVSYTELKTELKEALYKRQHNLMSKKGYAKFIEPYLAEGEQKLVIPAVCQKLDNADEAQTYFKTLFYLNVALLYHYASPTEHNVAMLEKYTAQLLHAIKDLNNAWQLSLDVETELQNTLDLFTRASKAFYKKLNFVKKGLLIAAAKLASK